MLASRIVRRLPVTAAALRPVAAVGLRAAARAFSASSASAESHDDFKPQVKAATDPASLKEQVDKVCSTVERSDVTPAACSTLTLAECGRGAAFKVLEL